MDGAELLRRVQDEHPEVVRMVLSGHAEQEAAMKAVPVAHQYLTKPCEPGLLENVVERTCNLQALIGDETLRQTVGRIQTLPSPPRIYAQLTSVLSDESVSVDRVAEILKQDMAMSAKILQIVNSAFFRLSRTISHVEDAVIYLGFDTIKNLALLRRGLRAWGGVFDSRPGCRSRGCRSTRCSRRPSRPSCSTRSAIGKTPSSRTPAARCRQTPPRYRASPSASPRSWRRH